MITSDDELCKWVGKGRMTPVKHPQEPTLSRGKPCRLLQAFESLGVVVHDAPGVVPLHRRSGFPHDQEVPRQGSPEAGFRACR